MAYCRRNQPSLRARSPATRRTHTCVYIAASLFGGSSVRAPWTPLASAVRCEFRAVIMDAALRGISTDAVVLAPGISAKLITAAEAEGDHVIPTSRATVVGKQFKVLATLAGLTMSELNALCTWLEEAYSPEAAERFEHDLKMMTPATLPSPAASGTGGASAAADAAAAKALAEAEASADSAAAKFAALKLSATGFAPMPKLLSTSTASGITANEAADNAAHGFTEAGMIALLTWTFMCARIPNMASDDVKYGVAPDHMHAAVSAARDYPPVAKRLADHWLEMQRYFANSARLMIRYYQKFLLNMRGRGLPDLIDRDLVLLVLCESTGNPGGDEEHAKQMKEMAEKLDKMKSLVDSLKETVSDLKGSVGSLKNEVKEAKGNSKWCSWCAAKGFKASGHLEKDCDKKKEAAKKVKADGKRERR